MLARLDKIEGVERSFTNRSGTLIRLTLLPTADQNAVVAHVAKIIDDESLPPLVEPKTVGEQEWRDSSRVSELTEIEWRTVRLRVGLPLAAFVVAAVAGVVWLVRRRRRNRL